MSQAQYSTQCQIERLRNVLRNLNVDPDMVRPNDMGTVISLAAEHGWYDAADFVNSMWLLVRSPVYRIAWTSSEKLPTKGDRVRIKAGTTITSTGKKNTRVCVKPFVITVFDAYEATSYDGDIDRKSTRLNSSH